jgi:hypothetical protein
MLAIHELARLSDGDLAALGVAEVSRACMQRLPGADRFDAQAITQTLAEWKGLAERHTEASLPRLRQKPENARLLDEALRARCLVAALTGEASVAFDAEGKLSGAVAAYFLDGLATTRLGTYATLPVLFAEVGRRLGYPLRLVAAQGRQVGGHLFARWHEPAGACFNVDLRSDGYISLPDDAYRTGPLEVTPAEEERGCLLRSMTPKMELAWLLANRGHYWLQVGNRRAAAEAFAFSFAVNPINQLTWNRLSKTLEDWTADVARRRPACFPDLRVCRPPGRFPDTLPPHVEATILLTAVTDNLLREEELERDYWWPLRQGLPVRYPARAVAVFDQRGCYTVHLHGEAFQAGPTPKPPPRVVEHPPPPLPPLLPVLSVAPPSAALSAPTAQMLAWRAAGVLPWKEYVRLPEPELGRHDLAAYHLACLAGIPDAEGVDVAACLRRLDEHARAVREFTEARLAAFRRDPGKYWNCEAYFRTLCLVTHLQRDRGLRYNPAKIPAEAVLDTADSFIHGALLGAGGTCATMPVVYAAVGRRLGYPIKLASARAGDYGHLFARWDGPGVRFNIEATAQGLSTHPDDYYRTGVYAATARLERAGTLLRSQTPQMELSGFLAERGLRLHELGMTRAAVEALVWAHALNAENDVLAGLIGEVVRRWQADLAARKPPRFPRVGGPRQRRWPDTVHPAAEGEVLELEATEALLDDPELERRFWGPQRRGEAVAVPSVAEVTFDAEGRGTGRLQW